MWPVHVIIDTAVTLKVLLISGVFLAALAGQPARVSEVWYVAMPAVNGIATMSCKRSRAKRAQIVLWQERY